MPASPKAAAIRNAASSGSLGAAVVGTRVARLSLPFSRPGTQARERAGGALGKRVLEGGGALRIGARAEQLGSGGGQAGMGLDLVHEVER
jgi:hypothetical protein